MNDLLSMMLGVSQGTVKCASASCGLPRGLSQPSSKAVHRILSNNARVMAGTIYIPNGELRIDASKPIADQSAYTAIVTNTMRLYGGPHLILNTNYSETDIPVPDGIKGAGQPVRLVE